MRVVFVEGKDGGGLLAWARGLPYPFWFLEGEGVCLVQVLGAGEEVLALAQALPGVRAWAFTLKEGVVYKNLG